MANERGHYGKNNGSLIVGQAPTIHIEHKSSSIGKVLLGAALVGDAVLYARHQSRQIEQLYKTGGMPYQTFTGSLRELPSKVRETYHQIAARVRPAAKPSTPTLASAAIAHSRRKVR